MILGHEKESLRVLRDAGGDRREQAAVRRGELAFWPDGDAMVRAAEGALCQRRSGGPRDPEVLEAGAWQPRDAQLRGGAPRSTVKRTDLTPMPRLGHDPVWRTVNPPCGLRQEAGESLDASTGGRVEVVLDMAAEVGAPKGFVEVGGLPGHIMQLRQPAVSGIEEDTAKFARGIPAEDPCGKDEWQALLVPPCLAKVPPWTRRVGMAKRDGGVADEEGGLMRGDVGMGCQRLEPGMKSGRAQEDTEEVDAGARGGVDADGGDLAEGNGMGNAHGEDGAAG